MHASSYVIMKSTSLIVAYSKMKTISFAELVSIFIYIMCQISQFDTLIEDILHLSEK